MGDLQYLQEISSKHRKEFGQFFTPPSVAKIMASWILKANPKRVLDPAFGLGVFIEELFAASPKGEIQFTGFEIDPIILNYYGRNKIPANLQLFPEDYLGAPINPFDGIICNPPYMRFQNFLSRHNILPRLEAQLGKKLLGYSNIASVFLVKSIKELAPNGNLAYIMPFEFFNTGYGVEIKKSLLETNLLKQIIIFSNEKEIFPDAITTVCVLLCRNDKKASPIKITVINNKTEIDTISDISKFFQKEIDPSFLPFERKWSPIILSLFSSEDHPEGFCKLSYYGSFRRGIATGANEFFSLTKEKIQKWGLSPKSICKCITKSSQIRKSVFTEDDFRKLFEANKPVYCLDVKSEPNSAAQEYILFGEKNEFHKRYLTKVRDKWYKIESRRPGEILFGVFNRGRLKVIRNFSEAITFTCYHSFVPNLFGQSITNKIFVYMLSDIGQRILRTNKRSYGNDLEKFEPGDLNDSLFPNPAQFDLLADSEVDQIVAIAKVNEAAAICSSNLLVERLMKGVK